MTAGSCEEVAKAVTASRSPCCHAFTTAACSAWTLSPSDFPRELHVGAKVESAP